MLKTAVATNITADIVEFSDALTIAGKKHRADHEFTARLRAIHQNNSCSVPE